MKIVFLFPRSSWMLKFSLSAMLGLLAAGCASAVRQPSEHGLVYFERFAVTEPNQSRNYPDPIKLTVGAAERSPEDIGAAVAMLMEIVPISRLHMATAKSRCEIDSAASASSAFVSCLPAFCALIPVGSRDSECGYVLQLEEWVQVNWLGGMCRIEPFDRESDLADWFRSKGVGDCHAMSVLTILAFMQEEVGIAWDADELIASILRE
ncbi:hypothetical protein [Arenimonas sp. MALMAid1274]|uniref:hypothetical protein n=1 Tax=Arenimonas sp. MALMAid1274 TaxID=3411630 RepID=UPI003BA03A3B